MNKDIHFSNKREFILFYRSLQFGEESICGKKMLRESSPEWFGVLGLDIYLLELSLAIEYM